MSGEDSKVCNGGPTLIFACSGAADVGEISDRAARKMTRNGFGTMFCLAGIGGRVEPIIQKTKSAAKILAIDGCKLDCVKGSLEQAGFAEFKHLRITDFGMEKGKTPATDDNINKAVEQAAAFLG